MLGNKSIIIIFSNILYTIDFKDFIYKHFFIKFIWKIFFLKILIDMNKHNKYNVLFFVKSYSTTVTVQNIFFYEIRNSIGKEMNININFFLILTKD